MYLKRKADMFLEQWKHDANRNPLIIKGPRQVGKTETIRAFAKRNYGNVVEINFVEEPKYKAITESGYSAAGIVEAISLIDPSNCFMAGNATPIDFGLSRGYSKVRGRA